MDILKFVLKQGVLTKIKISLLYVSTYMSQHGKLETWELKCVSIISVSHNNSLVKATQHGTRNVLNHQVPYVYTIMCTAWQQFSSLAACRPVDDKLNFLSVGAAVALASYSLHMVNCLAVYLLSLLPSGSSWSRTRTSLKYSTKVSTTLQVFIITVDLIVKNMLRET